MDETEAFAMDKCNREGIILLHQTKPNSAFSADFESDLRALRESFEKVVNSARRSLGRIKELAETRDETLHQIGELTLFIERLSVGIEEESKTPIKQPSQLSQKTFKLLRLKEAVETKTSIYNTLISIQDPSMRTKVEEISQRWVTVCEPLIKEYLTMKTASAEYGEFKTLAAQESDWLERLEKKLMKSANQAAADAEEISEELDDLENFLHNHSDERLTRIGDLAKSISEKGILIDSTRFVVGGSGGGSFANSEKNRANVLEDSKNLESKWKSLAKQARERVAILERSIAEAQEWEYKLIAVQDWLQGKILIDGFL